MFGFFTASYRISTLNVRTVGLKVVKVLAPWYRGRRLSVTLRYLGRIPFVLFQTPEVTQDVSEAGKVFHDVFPSFFFLFPDRGKRRDPYERVSVIRFSVPGDGARIRRRTDRLTCGSNAVVGPVAVKVLAPATASSV